MSGKEQDMSAKGRIIVGVYDKKNERTIELI
jgi:hypothetical protein